MVGSLCAIIDVMTPLSGLNLGASKFNAEIEELSKKVYLEGLIGIRPNEYAEIEEKFGIRSN